MIFSFFYIINVYKTKNICLNQKMTRAFVDTHNIHIPNTRRITFYHDMLCIFYDQFGAFIKVNLALKCTKK